MGIELYFKFEMNHDNEKAVYLNNTGGNGNDRSLNKNFRR